MAPTEHFSSTVIFYTLRVSPFMAHCSWALTACFDYLGMPSRMPGLCLIILTSLPPPAVPLRFTGNPSSESSLQAPTFELKASLLSDTALSAWS